MTRELICKGLKLNDDIQRLESTEKALMVDSDEHLLVDLIRDFNNVHEVSFANDDFLSIRNKFISLLQQAREKKEKELSDL